MIETISAVVWALMCWGAVLGGLYLAYTAARYGVDEMWNKLDQAMDLIWHINNVYEGEA